MFYSNKVISLFSKSQHIFHTTLLSLTFFSLHLSTFFIFHFIFPLLRGPNTIFLNLRAEKKRFHYYATEGVINKPIQLPNKTNGGKERGCSRASDTQEDVIPPDITTFRYKLSVFRLYTMTNICSPYIF